jgi:hypothetical protein
MEGALRALSMRPYRLENNTAHFDVSDAEFDNLGA